MSRLGEAASIAGIGVGTVFLAANLGAVHQLYTNPDTQTYPEALRYISPVWESAESKRNHARADQLGFQIISLYFDPETDSEITKNMATDRTYRGLKKYSVSREIPSDSKPGVTEKYTAYTWVDEDAAKANTILDATVQVDECRGKRCGTIRLSQFEQRAKFSVWNQVPDWVERSSIGGIAFAQPGDFDQIAK